MMDRRTLLGAAAVLGSNRLLSGGARGAGPAPQVTIRTGTVSGKIDRGIRAFLGIPYGAVTSGEWRHRPARPAARWRGVLDATQFGTIAPQAEAQIPADFQAVLNYREAAAPGEDCLRLNVWTPQTGDGGRRPVMVWFHGGGFVSGSGGIALYDGTKLAHRGDIVVVTVNHRLASFGYLDLSWTGAPRFAGSGNAGNLDLCLALQWVRDNIAAFGGNPGNVTIFGQSGGGAKVATVMAMPAARGLFHKAIIQSGPALRVRTATAAEAEARSFLEALGLTPTETDRLSDLPLEKLYAAEQKVGKGGLGAWGPVLDSKTLPAHPFDPHATPLAADVPLLIGWTAEETALFDAFLFRDPNFGEIDAAALAARCATLWGDASGAMIAAYRDDYPGLDEWDLWLRMKADAFAGIKSVRLAERKARQPAEVFVYRLDWRSPVDGSRLGAFHGLDQPLVFDNLALSPGWAGTGPEARALAARMSDAWIAFAHHGRPGTDALPPWPSYDANRRTTMLFDADCHVANDPASRVRQAWTALPPDKRPI